VPLAVRQRYSVCSSCKSLPVASSVCAASGREVDRLVASGFLGLEQQLLQRLWAGERVAVPLALQFKPDCQVQQMPEGMGSQVSPSTDNFCLHGLFAACMWHAAPCVTTFMPSAFCRGEALKPV
jgi:hypothetical protein